MLTGSQELSNFFYLLRLGLCSGFVLFLDGDVDFFTVDTSVTRRFYSESDLATFDLNDNDLDIVVNRDAFANFTGQN